MNRDTEFPAGAARAALLALWLVLLVACGGGGSSTALDSAGDPPADPPPDGTPPPAIQTLEAEVLALVNDIRTANGLDALLPHADVADVARAHSEDMAVRGFFDHVNPDGLDPGDRIAAAGIWNLGWGENIAAGYPGPESVVDAWMNSPGHRANILEPAWTHLGVGVFEGGSYGIYWTQNFLHY